MRARLARYSGLVVVASKNISAEYLQERTTMMQQWADYLDKFKAGADVMPLYGNAH